MIITRTPFRISFAGGGSDIQSYYEKYNGAVLSVTIDKYMHLAMHPLFQENEYLLKYSKIESIANIEDIKHPIIKNVFKRYGIKGVDFNASADIPSGTGLASSSAFTVGLINLCNAYTDKYIDKKNIAELACEIEINDLKAPIGKQDQYACASGGFNYIEFNTNGTVDVEKIYLKEHTYNKLNQNLLLFFTGQTRDSYSILSEQNANIKNDNKKIENMHKMVELAKILKKEMQEGHPDAMGEILHQSWLYKRELATGISNNNINDAYETAIKAGASGGKLLGAGGGGFLLFYVKEENQNNVRNALSSLKEIDFKFDNQGTNIIYYNKAGLYRK